MMIVMKLFAAKPDRDWRNVSALVFDVEVAVSNRVPDPVDYAGGPERNPDHLYAPDERPYEEAEQIDIDDQHHQNADPVERREEMSLEPVVWSPFTILIENPGLTNRLSIVEGAFDDDVAQSFYERTVWVSLAIGEGMMLPVTGHPLLGDNCSRKPQPDPHWQLGEIMQLHAAMGLSPV